MVVTSLGVGMYYYESQSVDEPKINEIDNFSIKPVDVITTTKAINSTVKDESWKSTVFPELYNEDGTRKITAKTVYVEKIPSGISEFVTLELVKDALKSWEKVNPDLKFEIVNNPDNALIMISWVSEIKFAPNVPKINYHVSGLTTSEIHEYLDGGIASQKHYIQIDTHDVNCKGDVIYWSKPTLTDTIKHEIGHALGIEHHSSDSNHLMYSEDDGINKILTHGLVVPEKISDFYYVDELDAIQNMNKLQKKYEETIQRYGYSVGEFEVGAIELGNEICGDQFCSEEMVSRVNAIIENELNPAIDDTNCYIESFNSLEEYQKYAR